VQKYVENITVPANSVTQIALTTISIPSGKAVYLRRVRCALGTLLPRVSATNVWTGSLSFEDVTLNVLLGSTSFVRLSVVNNTSNNVVLPSGSGIWAELEIR